MSEATIEVVASHPSAAFVYSAMKVNIELDGSLLKRDWGSHSFPVAPGTHEVAVSYPWLFMRRCGRRNVVVDVGSGETVRVSYHAHLIRYVPGKMTTEKVAA